MTPALRQHKCISDTVSGADDVIKTGNDKVVGACALSGKGEFGEVLLSKAKGIDEQDEETVVLVKSLQTRDEQLQLTFRREAEMFAKLSHPNVARLLGLCREAEPHYMILEYYDLVGSIMLKEIPHCRNVPQTTILMKSVCLV